MARKDIRLGRKVRYPITITKLHKHVGDKLAREETVFEYTYTWRREVGDPVDGVVWTENQITPVSWSSPVDGELLQWKIRAGEVVDHDMCCLEVDEPCSHDMQFGGLCVACGKDMSQVSWAMEGKDTDRATVNMTHDQTLLTVSHEKASQAEEELQRRLLKNRKLSLVVDLDQTVIHACIEPTIGEWQRDKDSPNHEAVKDIQSFQLPEDHKHGVPSGVWYYIKQRPGLKEFLAKIEQLYELHVYTMGTRAYAENVVSIIDPERRIFGDRVISRDENGSLSQKTLQRLFPKSTNMVAIIDDRADVWPRNRNNLIKVVPYDFYVGIGDINSSYLPKRQDIPGTPRKPTVLEAPQSTTLAQSSSLAEPRLDTSSTPLPSATVPDGTADTSSALLNLIKAVGSEDQTVRDIQEHEQAATLEKQLTERPLLHMQQKLDEEIEANGIVPPTLPINDENEKDIGESHIETIPEKHHLLKDDDQELTYLESHLVNLHTAFFEEYDNALAAVPNSRVTHLRLGHKKKLSLQDEAADLNLVPDVADVMPRLKSKTLAGTVLVLSGLVPLGTEPMRSELVLQAQSFGAIVRTKPSRGITHCVVAANRIRTQKVKQCSRLHKCQIVNHTWLLDSMSKWRRQEEELYLVDVPRDELAELADIEDDSASIGESSDGDLDEPGDVSPIDKLKTFDWAEADDELAEFMASGDEGDESDTGSVTSTTSNHTSSSSASYHPIKRPIEETGESDSDAESHIAKKKRLAAIRTTNLNPTSAPSLQVASRNSLDIDDLNGIAPTSAPSSPLASQVTVASDLDDAADDLNDIDLEAEMMAEFAKEDIANEADGA